MMESVQVRCPACQTALRLPRAALGQRAECPKCHRTIRLVAKAPAAAPAAPERSDAPVPAESPAGDFHFAFSQAGTVVAVSRARSHATRSLALIGLIALTLAAGAGWALSRSNLLRSPPPTDRAETQAAAGVESPGAPSDRSDAPPDRPTTTEAAFPRRFLFVGIHRSIYLNPISPTPADATSLQSIRAFAEQKLRVPRDQIYFVSDLGVDVGAAPPLKPIVQTTVARFLETCRPQDRIILMFLGHAAMIEGRGYLVPLEGELDDPGTLIPLDWLFERLKSSPARQKLLVFDVARRDPARGLERPDCGPLDPKLDALLAAPPPGVQIWTACTAGQHSYEFESANVRRFTVSGGAFLSLLLQAFSQGGNQQKPDDPLPLAFLERNVSGPTADIVARRERGAKQTPRLSGSMPATGASYDPAEPRPPRLESPKPAGPGGLASPREIRALIEEVATPSLRLAPGLGGGRSNPAEDAALLAESFPFSADVMKPYAADYQNLREVLDHPKKFPLRVAVFHAVEALDRQGRLHRVRLGDKEVPAEALIDQVRSLGSNDAIKKSLTKAQEDGPALMLVELQEVLEDLERVGRDRQREPSRRWQAHYDYVLALVKMRMAYVHEYNTMLAKVKRDELPPLNAQEHNGWRLAASDKLQSPKEVRDLAADAKRILDQIMIDHPGTPWAVLAKRARSTALGMTWQPTRLSAK
mgnify:CR=1 FL=1